MTKTFNFFENNSGEQFAEAVDSTTKWERINNRWTVILNSRFLHGTRHGRYQGSATGSSPRVAAKKIEF
jgi:hypothetical protein